MDCETCHPEAAEGLSMGGGRSPHHRGAPLPGVPRVRCQNCHEESRSHGAKAGDLLLLVKIDSVEEGEVQAFIVLLPRRLSKSLQPLLSSSLVRVSLLGRGGEFEVADYVMPAPYPLRMIKESVPHTVPPLYDISWSYRGTLPRGGGPWSLICKLLSRVEGAWVVSEEQVVPLPSGASGAPGR